MVKHACNLNYSRGRDRRITVQGQLMQKVSKILSEKPSWEWWSTPIIPPPQEAKLRGPQSRPARQKHKTLSEKQTKAKRAGAWLK
jgi:hypothetical protein